MSKQTIFFLRGAPASGKSTVAKSMMAHSNGGAKRVNRDEIREQLDFYSTVGDFQSEKLVSEIERENILTLLRKGKDVIVDVTLADPQYLRRYFDIVYNTGYDLEFSYISMGASLQECKENNNARKASGGRYVPEDVIVKMHNRIANTGDSFDKLFEHLIGEYEKNYALKNKYHISRHFEKDYVLIIDLDGTIAKMNGRSPYEWNKVHEDVLNAPLDLVLNSIAKEHFDKKMIFLSGRDDICYDDTLAWLQKHNLKVDALYMRKNRDMRPDWVVKLEILENEIIAKNQIPILSFDDRDSICKLWRHLGIPCYQVDFGNF